jgi:hypothetical protein
MPLKLNVGLNRKVGEPNYGSRGASINLELELELDSAVIDSPDRLRDRIRHLYSLANASINEELGIGAAATNGTAPAPGGRMPHAGPPGGQHSVNGAPRRATPSQVRALQAIARRRNLELSRLLHERFGVDSPDRLSVPEASRLIGELETRPATQPA